MREVRRDADYLDDPLLLEYVQSLWSPLVDIVRTKRWWIVTLQLFIGAALAAVALTPDGASVVSASWDGTVRVWELSTGRLVHTLEGHTDTVWAVELTRDGRLAVSASRDDGRGDREAPSRVEGLSAAADHLLASVEAAAG